jgi:hypothetical protein
MGNEARRNDGEFMGIIQTKYSQRDAVYAFGTTYAKKTIQCPDCLGTHKWTITFADGHSEECQCYTCARGWDGSLGVIHYSEWQPTVEKITITEVRYGSEGAEYLSDYWGITDSGEPFHGTHIYRDEDLFDNEADAQVAAEAAYERRMADLADNNFPKKGDFAKALERSTFGYCRYDAIRKTAEMKQ